MGLTLGPISKVKLPRKRKKEFPKIPTPSTVRTIIPIANFAETLTSIFTGHSF